MNDPGRLLSPETLDELLSADLDGELDRAAPELGLTADDARAALAAAPDAAARRAELIHARDLLARHPALEPARELQIVAAVLDRLATEGRPADRNRIEHRRLRNSWRALVAAGSVAAVAAVAVGIVVLLAKSPSTGGSKSSAAPRAAAAPEGSSRAAGVAPGRAVAFGDVSETTTLLTEVRAQLTARSLKSASATTAAGRVVGNDGPLYATPDSPNPQGTTGAHGVAGGDAAVGLHATKGARGPTGARGATGPTGPIGAPGPQGLIGSDGAQTAPTTQGACINQVERTARLRVEPTLSGTGSDAGRPVYVVVFPQAKSFVVFVLSATDCSVVQRETLP